MNKSGLSLIQIVFFCHLLTAMAHVEEGSSDRSLREALIREPGERIVSCKFKYCVEKEEQMYLNPKNSKIMIPNNLNITCTRCKKKGSLLAVRPKQLKTNKFIFRVKPRSCPLYVRTIRKVNNGCKC